MHKNDFIRSRIKKNCLKKWDCVTLCRIFQWRIIFFNCDTVIMIEKYWWSSSTWMDYVSIRRREQVVELDFEPINCDQIVSYFLHLIFNNSQNKKIRRKQSCLFEMLYSVHPFQSSLRKAICLRTASTIFGPKNDPVTGHP